jgi:hypothetical protein
MLSAEHAEEAPLLSRLTLTLVLYYLQAFKWTLIVITLSTIMILLTVVILLFYLDVVRTRVLPLFALVLMGGRAGLSAVASFLSFFFFRSESRHARTAAAHVVHLVQVRQLRRLSRQLLRRQPSRGAVNTTYHYRGGGCWCVCVYSTIDKTAEYDSTLFSVNEWL